MRFSIVVPTHRRPRALEHCLNSLAALDYPKSEFEVVVVDDASYYSASDVVDRFRVSLNVRLINLRRQTGPATARTMCAREARGDIVAFTDDDCSPDAGWLRALEAAFPRDPGLLAVGGRTLNECANNVFSTATQYLLEFLLEWYNRDPESARFFPTLNLACGRKAFLEIGGFDASFPLAAAEDRDFCDRWREAGGRLVFAESAVVGHAHRLTLRRFLRQHFSYGRGAVHLHAARVERGVALPRLEPMTFYGQLVFFALRRERRPRTPLLVILAGLTQVSYACGYYFERLRRRTHPTRAPVPEEDKDPHSLEMVASESERSER